MTEAAGRRPGQPRAGWTGRLWADIEGTYAAILDHPFIRGLTSGDLAPEAFFYYLSQDDHYVREFSRAVALVGVKAPDAGAATVLTRHAAQGLTAESTLHQVLVADLGGDPAALAKVQPGPTTQAYTSYVLSADVPRRLRRGADRRAAVPVDLRGSGAAPAPAGLAQPGLPALDRHLRR